MKIEMLDSRNIPGHGLRNTGTVWNPPKKLGEQLCSQGFAKLFAGPTVSRAKSSEIPAAETAKQTDQPKENGK